MGEMDHASKEVVLLMKNRLSIGLVVFALSLAFLPSAWAADDGAHLYKSKCSHCHGKAGEGKKGPALKGTSMSADDIAGFLTKGDAQKKAPHSKAFSGLDDAKAKAIADYIKTLQ
jgi:mono/diheme cytochrome c family protein